MQVCAFSEPEAAQALSVSRRTVQSAAQVQKEAPELVPQIERGEKTLSQATREIKRKRNREQAEPGNHKLLG